MGRKEKRSIIQRLFSDHLWLSSSKLSRQQIVNSYSHLRMPLWMPPAQSGGPGGREVPLWLLLLVLLFLALTLCWLGRRIAGMCCRTSSYIPLYNTLPPETQEYWTYGAIAWPAQEEKPAPIIYADCSTIPIITTCRTTPGRTSPRFL